MRLCIIALLIISICPLGLCQNRELPPNVKKEFDNALNSEHNKYFEYEIPPKKGFTIFGKNTTIAMHNFGSSLVFSFKKEGSKKDLPKQDQLFWKADDANKKWIYTLNQGSLSSIDWQKIPKDYHVELRTQVGKFFLSSDTQYTIMAYNDFVEIVSPFQKCKGLGTRDWWTTLGIFVENNLPPLAFLWEVTPKKGNWRVRLRVTASDLLDTSQFYTPLIELDYDEYEYLYDRLIGDEVRDKLLGQS